MASCLCKSLALTAGKMAFMGREFNGQRAVRTGVVVPNTYVKNGA